MPQWSAEYLCVCAGAPWPTARELCRSLSSHAPTASLPLGLLCAPALQGLCTPSEVFVALAAEGYRLSYQRAPMSRERTPQPADLDALQRQMTNYPPGGSPVYIFLSRTATGSSVRFAAAFACTYLRQGTAAASPVAGVCKCVCCLCCAAWEGIAYGRFVLQSYSTASCFPSVRSLPQARPVPVSWLLVVQAKLPCHCCRCCCPCQPQFPAMLLFLG